MGVSKICRDKLRSMNEQGIAVDNPAGRLLDLFVEMQSTQGGVVQECFCTIFKIPKDDYGQLVAMLATCHRTIDDVEAKLKSAKKDHLIASYQKTATRLKLAVSPANFSMAWKNFTTEYIKDKDLTALEIFSAELSRSCPEKVMGKEELAELLKKLNAVFESVLRSSLEDELKTLILDGLEDLRRAIQEYRIRGMVGIEAAISKNVVNAVMTQDIPVQVSKEGQLSALDQFRAFVKDAAAFATLNHYLFPAYAEITRRLLTP
jgi:hypothetical protein